MSRTIPRTDREAILRDAMTLTRVRYISSHLTNEHLAKVVGMSVAWVTARLQPCSHHVPVSYLTPEQTESLSLLGRSRTALKALFNVNDIAATHGITVTYVHMICSGRRWGINSSRVGNGLRSDLANLLLAAPIEAFIAELDSEERMDAVLSVLTGAERLHLPLYESITAPISDPAKEFHIRRPIYKMSI